MPLKKFINLPSHKKDAILTRAMDEFTQTPYEQIAVSSLVTKLHICRASFYSYFEDKDDLLRCVLDWMEGNMKQHIVCVFQKHDGNFYDSMKELLETSLYDDTGQSYSTFFNQIMKNEKSRKIAQENEYLLNQHIRKDQDFYRITSTKLCQGLDEMELIGAMMIGILVIIKSMFLNSTGLWDPGMIEKMGVTELMILDKGIRA